VSFMVWLFWDRISQACRNSNKWFAGHPEYAHLGLSLASDTLAYTGHWAKHGS
jgi:hypothetical protein